MVGVESTTTERAWVAPGPGTWRLDASHAPPNPTPIYQRMTRVTIESGLTTALERYGAPLAGMQVRFVRGKFYTRLVPLVGGDKDRPPPPAPVLWLASRLHPAFRQRNKVARAAFTQKTWRHHLDKWWREDRRRCLDENLALQGEDPGAMDDAALAAHTQRAYDLLVNGCILHHELHGVDLGPIGDLLAHTTRWGIPPGDVVVALVGASPASCEAAGELRRLGEIVAASGTTPQSLDDVRNLGEEASRLLDEYLRHFGWRIVTSYDLEGRALIEMPDAILSSILANTAPRPSVDGTALIAGIRDRVPEEHRPLFDELMQDARTVYGLRDDNGPLTAEWRLGLLRRALLEVGRRLADRGRVRDAAHVFELDIHEIGPVLLGDGTAGPTAEELVARAAERASWATEEAPPSLGPPEDEPPLHLMPKPLARGVAAVLAAVSAIDPPAHRKPLEGTGIGDGAYRGKARVAHCPEDVLATMEPGDVLVAAWTAPTYNTVLSIAGAIVTEEGGVLCHAAVMARELGIPAVIGAQGAMRAIPDGATIEVDPIGGRVKVV